jgi:hypothetical protein
MTKTEIQTLLPWRSVTTDAIEYDPLTGNYRYTEPHVEPSEYNEYWTPMGQPRKQEMWDQDVWKKNFKKQSEERLLQKKRREQQQADES